MKTNIAINKLGKILLTIIIFSLLAITYFYWQPYDKCLFQPVLTIDTIIILDFITRLLYYLLYISSIIFIISMLFKSKLNLLYKKDKIEIAKIYFIILFIRFIFDFIIYILNKLVLNDLGKVILIFLLLESTFNITVIIIAIRKICFTKAANKTLLRKWFAISSAVLITTSLCLITYEYIKCYSFLDSDIQVWENKLYCCNLFRDIIVNSSAVIIAYAILMHKDHKTQRPFKEFSIITLRISLILGAFILINLLKFIVLPHSMIKSIDSIDGTVTEINRVISYDDAYNSEF